MGYKIIKCQIGDKNYSLFEEVALRLYDKESPRWILGNDPKAKNLEGCYILLSNGEPIGRLAYYVNPHLKYQDLSTATIGSYECIDNLDASQFLLQFTLEKTTEEGYKWLLGPMEGSTWNSYRFSLHNDHPNFFMEPYHHIYYNDQFVKFGFKPIAHFVSNRDNRIFVDEHKLATMKEKFESKGLRFRSIDMDNLSSELQKIGALSIAAFSNNFLYSPITIQAFVDSFQKLGHYFDPDFILMAEDEDGQLQGFSFTIPDYLDPNNETIIIKSMARRPGDKLKGIGYYLSAKTLEIGQRKGYKKALHAMMISDNVSLDISKNYGGNDFKQYALYGLNTDNH